MKTKKMQTQELGKKSSLRKIKPVKNSNITPKKKKRK